jgi:hypothetical protein
MERAAPFALISLAPTGAVCAFVLPFGVIFRALFAVDVVLAEELLVLAVAVALLCADAAVALRGVALEVAVALLCVDVDVALRGVALEVAVAVALRDVDACERLRCCSRNQGVDELPDAGSACRACICEQCWCACARTHA